MGSAPVTLQISLAPSDFRHARVLLPHQVKAWRDQVSEVLLTVDFHRSSGHFSTAWGEGNDKIIPLACSVDGARVLPVDYGPEAMARTGAEFFGGRTLPAKDFRGGPYYSYFYALGSAQHDHVLHLDADMFFGGGSQEWLQEAVAYMTSHPEVVFAAPLPGPPAPDGQLRSQRATAEPDTPYAFRFNSMSTRLFLASRSQLRSAFGRLCPRRPQHWRNTIKALLERNPAQELPEELLTHAMRTRGLARREFLGTGRGMWSLHPPYRCAAFYSKLPDLVRRVEEDDIPPGQRGDHDINDSMVDWSEARTALAYNRWWRRLLGASRR